MRVSTLAAAVLATLVASTAAGCTSHTAAAGHATSAATGPVAAQQVTIHATDTLRFSPDTATVRVGTVTITLVNDGSYPHNLAITSLGAHTADVSGNPGQQRATLTLHLASPGTYQFVCTYHASAGMRGQLVVRP